MTKLFTLALFFLAACTLNAQTVLLEQNFEGTGIPAGWTQTTSASDGGWKFGTPASLSSSGWAIQNAGSKVAATNDDGCNCTKNNDFLILPSLDLSTYTAASMKFDLFFGDRVYQTIGEDAFVKASIDGGTTWTTVKKLPGNTDGWQVGYTVDLSSLAGNSNVKIAFHYTDGGGWLYGCAIDNISVTVPADFDISARSLNVPRFALFGNTVTVQGEVQNLGATTLTSFDISWSDGINTYTDVVSGVNIPFLGTSAFTHTTTMPLPQAVGYNYSVWADNPNGVTDGNPANNNLDGVVNGVTYIPNKKMVAEEGTGTWCGWCPRGTDWMEFMADIYDDNFVGIAVHNGDPMVLTAYDAGVGAFPGFGGYPGVIVDRLEVIDPSDLEDYLPSSIDRIAPVAPAVVATLDVATKTLTVNASAEFVTQLDDLNYRLNVILTEDGVKGAGTGYNQVNYYSFQSQNLADPIAGYGLDWQTENNPVLAAKMVYDHVARALLGGFTGSASSIPASVVAGQVATKDYSLTNFNTAWNPFNMHAVVAVLNSATGEYLNAESEKIDVICPADFGAVLTVQDATTGNSDGSVTVTPPNPAFGFGGYTYLWSTGATTVNLTGVAAGPYTLTVSDKIGCSQTVNVTVGSMTAVQDIEQLASFSLTPNPASTTSVLNVSFTEAVDMNLKVVNTLGQVMHETSVNRTLGGQHILDLSSYANGLYLVKVSVGDQVHTERLMISK